LFLIDKRVQFVREYPLKLFSSFLCEPTTTTMNLLLCCDDDDEHSDNGPSERTCEELAVDVFYSGRQLAAHWPPPNKQQSSQPALGSRQRHHDVVDDNEHRPAGWLVHGPVRGGKEIELDNYLLHNSLLIKRAGGGAQLGMIMSS
jgi:hypothetical protein